MKFSKKLLGIIGGAVTASTVLGGTFIQTANAADQTGNGAEGIVAYHHEGGGNEGRKYVDYNFVADDHGYTHAVDLGVYPQDVYCINPTRNPGDQPEKNQHFRWRWNLGANPWLYDNSSNMLENRENATNSSQLDGLAQIINYGQTNGYSYADIQNAVFWFVCFGNNAPDYAGQQYQNAITDAYKNGQTKAPASYNLYMYIPDSDVTEAVQNTVGLAVWQQEEETTTSEEETTTSEEETTTSEEETTTSEEETTTSEEETTASEAETTTSEEESSSDVKREGVLKTTVSVKGKESTSTKPVEVEAGKYDVKDKIDYEGLTAGATYTVSGTLVCVEDESVIAEKTEEHKADVESGTWTITFKGVTLSENKKYVVYEKAVNNENDKDVAEHRDINDKSQTVIVIEQKTTTSTAEEETTTTEEEETTTTAKEETTTTTKEETTTTAEEENTTTASSEKGELATTVKAGDKTGSSDKAIQLTYDETKEITSITDTISYKNLVNGVVYTVTGTLVEVDANGKVTNPEVATNTIDCTADDENGEWTMNFDNVTLQASKKYVVFESAYTAGGEDENATQDNPITHKDVNDKAQTIITEGENEKILDDVEEESTSATVIASADSNENNGGSDNNSGNNNGNNGGSNSNGSSSKGSSGPNTGDSVNTALYVTAAVAAAGIAATSIALGKKKRSKN